MLQWIIYLVIGAVLLSAAAAGLSAAPWLPTKPKQRKAIAKATDIKPKSICYDLGCGDGSMLFTLANMYPDCRAIGYDISLLPLFIGWVRKLFGITKYKNVSLRFGNLFNKDISNADVIFVFLLDKSYPRLIEKFRKELKPETQVIVEAWPLPEIEPVKTIKEDGLLPIYIYSGESFNQ